jgi:hypothetical protein
VLRSALLAACVALALCTAPPSAYADDLDLALSRLRIASQKPNCGSRNRGTFCADQELFERLVSELAVAMAPAVVGPARTIGPRSFQLTFGTTVTSIEGGQLYWRRGSEGNDGLSQPEDLRETPPPVDESAGPALGFNESPPAALAWNHVQVRKGLPFGLEAGALLGQGLQTSMWTLGAALKWSLFEGFRSGLGQLPDVALQAAISRSVGSSQATLHLYVFDLTFSKPFVVEQTWSASPFLGFQLLRTDVESGVVDLTPGGPSASPGAPPPEDAYNSCRPLPGHQVTATSSATIACTTEADGIDFANDVIFDPVGQSRLRMFLGGQTRYDMFVFAASLLFDVIVPALAADMDKRHIDSPDLAHQVAFSMSIGAVL